MEIKSSQVEMEREEEDKRDAFDNRKSVLQAGYCFFNHRVVPRKPPFARVRHLRSLTALL